MAFVLRNRENRLPKSRMKGVENFIASVQDGDVYNIG